MRLPYGPGPSQFGDLRLPESPGPHPVVLVIHGGFWRVAYDLEYINPVCEALTRLGAATWNLEYRRIGQSRSPATTKPPLPPAETMPG